MKLETLLKKREKLDAEILAAQALEDRKKEILEMPEFVKISSLSDDVLRAEFTKIAERN
jgi:hypothetical protein